MVFASDRRAILALAGIPRRLNDLYLARILVSWASADGAETALQDLHRLPPAHVLHAAPGLMRTERYWCIEDVREVRLANQAEYADGLLEHLRMAVRARVRSFGAVTSTLSGGLDSGAVTALGVRELASDGRSLTALTSVPMFRTNVEGNEFPLASASARMAGVSDHRAIRADTTSPLDGAERMLAIHGQPGYAAPNYYWIFSVLAEAKSSVLLTGQTGNSSFSWTGVPTVAEAVTAIARGDLRGARVAAASLVKTGGFLRKCRSLKDAVRRSDGVQPWRPVSAIHPMICRTASAAGPYGGGWL